MSTTSRNQLETPIDGLLATPPAPLPYVSSLSVRAFVLPRAAGTIVVYDAPGISAAAEEIRALGPVDRWVINHEHEAVFGAQDGVGGAWVHERDRAASAGLPIAGTFSERETLGDDCEVIPTPGHTPGATAFLWDSGDHRFLFTGDSVWFEGGEWQAAVLGSSDRAAYLRSLALLRDLDFDVLVPWAAPEGEPFVQAVTPAEARAQLDAIIARVEAGAAR